MGNYCLGIWVGYGKQEGNNCCACHLCWLCLRTSSGLAVCYCFCAMICVNQYVHLMLRIRSFSGPGWKGTPTTTTITTQFTFLFNMPQPSWGVFPTDRETISLRLVIKNGQFIFLIRNRPKELSSLPSIRDTVTSELAQSSVTYHQWPSSCSFWRKFSSIQHVKANCMAGQLSCHQGSSQKLYFPTSQN